MTASLVHHIAVDKLVLKATIVNVNVSRPLTTSSSFCRANQDLETFTQKHQQENAKLKAIIKKLEVKSKSLEETLEQKTKENQALTAICDELINKVGD